MTEPRVYDPLLEGEPERGSVLLLEGLTGTAYQRHFTDGLYHGTGGKVLTFSDLLAKAAREGASRMYMLHDTAAYLADDELVDAPPTIYVDGAVADSDRGYR